MTPRRSPPAESISAEARRRLALTQALAVARSLGITVRRPRILRDSNHTTIHLWPAPIVARVVTRLHPPESRAQLKREWLVAQHLARCSAPIVAPSTEVPAGVHRLDDTRLTFWRFVAHDPDGRPSAAAAGATFREVSAALQTYPGKLPSYTASIDACRTLLDDRGAASTLRDADRRFLIAEHERLMQSLPAANLDVLHGDPHLGNVLVTPRGLLWTDFESACRGPLEWDLTCLPPGALRYSSQHNAARLSVLQDLRSLCVAVWCSAQPQRSPRVRAAAAFHLTRLRRRRRLV